MNAKQPSRVVHGWWGDALKNTMFSDGAIVELCNIRRVLAAVCPTRALPAGSPISETSHSSKPLEKGRSSEFGRYTYDTDYLNISV